MHLVRNTRTRKWTKVPKVENPHWCPVTSIPRTMTTNTITNLFCQNQTVPPSTIMLGELLCCLKKGVHAQLRWEGAQKAASQPGGQTDDNGSTVPARDMEDTNFSPRKNNRSGDGDRKQQLPAFPSQNSSHTDPNPPGLP